jgi:hypothetical protein
MSIQHATMQQSFAEDLLVTFDEQLQDCASCDHVTQSHVPFLSAEDDAAFLRHTRRALEKIRHTSKELPPPGKFCKQNSSDTRTRRPSLAVSESQPSSSHVTYRIPKVEDEWEKIALNLEFVI